MKPINKLSDSELGELIKWKQSRSYKLLMEVLEGGTIVSTNKLLTDPMTSPQDMNQFYHLKGQYSQLSRIKEIPKKCQQVLDERKKNA